MYSNMSPDSPLRPSLFPATLNDWHGLPPTTTSHLPLNFFQLTLVTSPTLGTSGYLCSSTAHGNGSSSAKHTGFQPSGSHATVAASIPLKSDMYLMSPMP